MKITFPEKQPNLAELFIDGNPINYRIPPVTGTHSECFSESNSNEEVRRATGKEIVAYAYGALAHKKNKWAYQERILFPAKKYLRVPVVLTIVPKRKEFGDLEGMMIVDKDLKGEGIAMKTEVPANLSGWIMSEYGILERNGRIAVPYDKWYKKQWDEDNGAVIAIFEGKDSASLLAKTAKDSGIKDRPLWSVNPVEITIPEKRVPVMDGCDVGGLYLDCDDDGDGSGGCAVRVLK